MAERMALGADISSCSPTSTVGAGQRRVFGSDPARRNDAGVLGYSGRFGAHALQADVRRDVNSVYGGNTTGRVGYAFDVAGRLKLRALAGTSYRAPTFNDLYFPGFGVETVRPEHGRSVEFGLSWARRRREPRRPCTATACAT